MLQKLRHILLSLPVLTVAGLFALYLGFGFWGLPALVQWQAAKLVHDKLGQNLTLTDVRFNPLVFKLEVRNLALSDDEGQPMLGFERLFVDFELWRSLVEQTWTFAEATLQAPNLYLDLHKDGRHNFSAMIDKLGGEDAQPQQAASRPHLAIAHLAITDGQIDVSDQILAEPLLMHMTPLTLSVDGLSTVAKEAASYNLAARTAQGETLAGKGHLRLNPVAVQGQLALTNIQVNTLARALSRLVAIDAPAGQLAASASFDLAVDAQKQLAGTLQDVTLDLSALSLAASGGTAPLLAIKTVGLTQGRVDLGQRQVHFPQFTLDQGQFNAATDAQGRLDWATLVRPSAETPPEPPAAAPWHLAIDQTTVTSLAVDFEDARQGLHAKIGSLTLTGSPSGEFDAAGLTLEVGQPRLMLADVQLKRPDESFSATLTEVALQAERATMNQGTAETRAALSGTRLSLAGATLSLGDQSATFAEWVAQSKELSLQSTPGQSAVTLKRWQSTLSQLKAQRSTETAALDQITVNSALATVKQVSNGPLSLSLQGTAVQTRGTALHRGDDGLALRSAKLAAERLALTQENGRLQLDGQFANLGLTGLTAQQGENHLALEVGGFKTGQLTLDTAGHAPSASPARAAHLRAGLNDDAVRMEALSVRALGAKADVGQIAQLNLAAQSLQLALPEGPVELTGQAMSADMTQAVVHSPADGAELVRLGHTALVGAAVHLPEQQFTAETLTLAQGQVNAWLDAQGQINLLKLFDHAAQPGAVAAPALSATPPVTNASTKATPWRVAVQQTLLDEFTVNFADRSVQPALALRFEPIRVRLDALDTGASTPMHLELQTTLASGGEIRVDGTVQADSGAADLQLSLSDIALAPVQTYLSKFAELQLATGVASSHGRLRYGDPQGAGAQLVYQGQAAVDQFLLEEIEPKRPFLSWAAVGSDDVLLTLQPNRLDIAELRIEKPAGRLIIAADQSLNLTDVLKKDDTATSAPAQASDTPIEDKTAASDFPVSIARVRVADGTLEFSDASLRPQFAARMHELKGVITSLSNDPERSAKVQLDARVNHYGASRIAGQISLLNPEKLTEIDMAFRNLAMTSLSPYVVKFAGYQIAGGRLWLDLQYRVKDGKLRGKNKVLLKKVKLGKQVESPDALDLPLELAIAILADSDGVIDIALPVSGNLSDPQFDYGAVIGKAIGNLLGGIVTAPFKALAAIFGGADKTLDTVVFEPGTALLAPPERQKLAAVARALKERPKLKLVVPPTSSDTLDTPALKSLAVRRDVVAAMGITLAADEDPGPVDVANARTQKAVEVVFSTRYAPEVLAALKARAMDTADAPADQAPAPAPVTEAAASAAAAPRPPPPAFYQGLFDRLLTEQALPQEALAQLATRRSDAILHELSQTNGVSDTRISMGQAQQARAVDGKTVTLQMQLEVAK